MRSKRGNERQETSGKEKGGRKQEDCGGKQCKVRGEAR